MASPALPDRASGRRMLLTLAAALALPFVLAGVLIFSGWQPGTGRHYGTLLPPMAPLSLDALDVRAGPTGQQLAGHWLLVAYEPAPCAEACMQRLDTLRRVHVALYKAMPRVKRVALMTAAPPPELAAAQPDLALASASNWSALVTTVAEPAFWLVDPRGHAVMRYDPATTEFSPKGMLKDAERLLRYSWTG